MKRIILILFLFCCTVISVSAQKAKTSDELTDKQWQDLFTALGSENWTSAFELSSNYLKLLKNDDKADSIANLRYMYLYSAAGKVSEGNMSYDELEKNIKDVAGKQIALPFHPIEKNCEGGVNFNFVCSSDKGKDQAMITAANAAATTIFSFEYIQLKEDFDFAKHNGELGAVIGTVKSIEPNPNKSKILIMRIYISDAYIKLRESETGKPNENTMTGK